MKYRDVDADRSGVTLLVVEDNPALNALFKNYLVQQQFKVLTALDFDEAMAVISSKESIDIALIDYDLGDRKGLDLIAHFQHREIQQHIPVIVLGSSDDQSVLQQCFELGVDDYVVKPVNPLLLSLKIDSLVYNVRLAKIIAEKNDQLQSLITKARLEEEMASHIFYNHLLSRQTRAVKGFNHYLKSSEGFSGDIILARYAPSGSIFILHADATGHGLSATITLMPMVAIFKAMVHKGYRLEPIIREINTRLLEQLPSDRFVAASVVEIDLHHGDVKVWNGGMPELLMLDDQHQISHRFRSAHMALGILPDKTFEVRAEHCKLPGNGYLLSYSDGVVEQCDAVGRSFGVGRLLRSIRESEADLLQPLMKALFSHVRSDNFDDDVSMYEVRFNQLANPHQLLKPIQSLTQDMKTIAPFEWFLELVGAQVAHQELPSMCNQFLSGMGFDQSICQRCFTIVSELVNNAIDHGILKLTSLLKVGAEGFMAYYQEREQRLAALTDKDRLGLRLKWCVDDQGLALQIEVQDSGEGYLAEQCQKADVSDTHAFGRGLSLVQRLSSSVEIRQGGTFVRAILR